MSQQFDSSLIPTDAEHDKHWASTPQCHHCAEDMSDDDIEIEKEMGDGLCEECRAMREEGHEL